MLAVLVLLYVVATAAGARQGSGGTGSSGKGLPETLGRVLVLPAGGGDVVATAAACRQGDVLTVAAGGACRYRLKSGFLGKRLTLRLDAGTQLTAELVQPKPKVTDSETLDSGHTIVDLVYHEEGSTLTLRCDDTKGPDCRAGMG